MNDPASLAPTKRRLRPAAFEYLGFRQLTRAWFTAYLAESAFSLMMAVWVREVTGSDGAGAMVLVMMNASALLAPFVGQIADRVLRKRLLIWANLGTVGAMLSLLSVDGVDGVWVIYGVTFLFGVMGLVTTAAGSGLIRDILPDKALGSGNGVLATIDQGLRLVSPLVGAGLYRVYGPYAVIVFTALCFGATALLVRRVEVQESAAGTREPSESYRQDIAAGFRHLRVSGALGVLTLLVGLSWAAIGLVNAAVFAVISQGLNVESEFLGVLVSLQGAGALIGGVTAAKMIRRLSEPRMVGIGLTLWALGVVPLLGSSVAAALGGMAFVGLGVTWAMVGYATFRQRLTPPRLQGRAAAASEVAFKVPLTITIFAAAAAVDSLDYRILILAAIAVIAVSGLVALGRRGPQPY